MEIAIYVNNDADLTAGNLLTTKFAGRQNGSTLQVINVMDPAMEEIPAEVVQAMITKKLDTFPLTLFDGKPHVYGRIPTPEILETLIRDVSNAAKNVALEHSRIHVSIDVNDFERSLTFYKILFDAEPVKLKPDYAQFILSDPPVNLVLNDFGRKVSSKDAPTNHFGIQVKDKARVTRAKERYMKHGFHYVEENEVSCCYSLQTKIWVADPDGMKWEVYVAEAETNDGCGPTCICWEEIKPSA